MGRKIDPDRLAAVEQALTAMESPSLIVRRLAREWSCKPKQVERYIHEVLQRWRAVEAMTSVDDWRQRLVMMTIDCYRMARESKQLRAAGELVELLARLLGVSQSNARGIVNIYSQTGAYTSEAGKAITAQVRALLDEGDKGEGGDRN